MAVSKGLFTTTLDFGVTPFYVGQGRWLQIEFRTNGATAFTPLSPRQSLTATPYSLYGRYAGTAATASRVAAGSISSALLADGSVTSDKMATGAVAANLAVSGQTAVPSGGMILSSNASDATRLSAGYVKLGRLEAANAWEQRANFPSSARVSYIAVWTGSEMIIWGGTSGTSFNDGGRYSPTANTWDPMPTANGPGALAGHIAIWTGSQMIVWGGAGGSDTFSYTVPRGLYLYQRP